MPIKCTTEASKRQCVCLLRSTDETSIRDHFSVVLAPCCAESPSGSKPRREWSARFSAIYLRDIFNPRLQEARSSKKSKTLHSTLCSDNNRSVCAEVKFGTLGPHCIAYTRFCENIRSQRIDSRLRTPLQLSRGSTPVKVCENTQIMGRISVGLFLVCEPYINCPIGVRSWILTGHL